MAALADRGRKGVEIEQRRCRRQEAEPLEAGHGQNGGIDLAGLELAQPGLDIAAERHDGEIGPRAFEQSLAPQRGGADHGAVRQFTDAFGGAADEGVARVLARQECRQHQASRQHGRHVLRGMHGEIDGTGEQRLLDLLGEKAFAAGFRQRPVLDHVAAGADDFDLDPLRGDAMGLGEPGLHFVGLHQRQRRTARTRYAKSGL